ncbi:MAG TPA: methyltransferase domain-containing protein [Acidimicrobiales bacterium]|nr:methyltransferase domain-containing protein [Acidimicrobiales bacterium]
MTGSVPPAAGDQYRDLADDYEWLVPDEHVEAEAVLDRLGDRFAARTDPTVLDCACGVGADAVALARRGHRVWGSDGSEAMVRAARRRVAEAGVEVPLRVCRWKDLPGTFDQRFDLVLCLGNSVSHLRAEEMIVSFQGMAGVLGPGGLMVVNARNWEKLRRERRRLTFPDRVLQRDGRRCVPLYVWSYAPEWESAHEVEIIFLVDTDGSLAARRHKLTFWPFRVGDLRDRLETSGLRVLDDTYRTDGDWYEVVAEKPSG